MTLDGFIKSRNLKREIPFDSSRLDREPGDYFVTHSKMGTRVDWAEKNVIAGYAFIDTI